MSEQKKPAGERRGQERVQLDSPLFAVLETCDEDSLRVMIADISDGGAQLLLPPGRSPADLADKSPLRLSGFPPSFSLLNGVEINLVWSGPANCGVKFAKAAAQDENSGQR